MARVIFFVDWIVRTLRLSARSWPPAICQEPASAFVAATATSADLTAAPALELTLELALDGAVLCSSVPNCWLKAVIALSRASPSGSRPVSRMLSNRSDWLDLK
jgi:hypothetical protein